MLLDHQKLQTRISKSIKTNCKTLNSLGTYTPLQNSLYQDFTISTLLYIWEWLERNQMHNNNNTFEEGLLASETL
jgi:hypothetical protein